jgi:hypothetical protein
MVRLGKLSKDETHADRFKIPKEGTTWNTTFKGGLEETFVGFASLSQK